MKRRIALLGLLVIMFVAINWTPMATAAETMKCRTAGWAKVSESVPAGDVEGHALGITSRVGMAFFDNGDVANFTTVSSWNIFAGKGGDAAGYALFNFVDGSTFVTKFSQSYVPPTDPNYTMETVQATGEILSGTGRFAGIKGTLSFTGKSLKPIKGELGGRSSVDYTFTYTLPAK
jgi:hypothetical protein